MSTKTNLAVSDAEARNIYPDAPPALKKIMENSFRPGFFSQKITDRIKTFADVCAELGYTEEHFFNRCSDDNLSADEIAYRQVKLICEVLNEGWKPNWNDDDEYKFRPWFCLDAPGFRFFVSFYGYSGSGVGARLTLKSRELSDYAGKTFLDIYKQFFTA